MGSPHDGASLPPPGSSSNFFQDGPKLRGLGRLPSASRLQTSLSSCGRALQPAREGTGRRHLVPFLGAFSHGTPSGDDTFSGNHSNISLSCPQPGTPTGSHFPPRPVLVPLVLLPGLPGSPAPLGPSRNGRQSP